LYETIFNKDNIGINYITIHELINKLEDINLISNEFKKYDNDNIEYIYSKYKTKCSNKISLKIIKPENNYM
jgi:hypothetical protein